MPRGTAGASGSSGNDVSFRGAEQSLHIMRQVKSYFNVGMDHVLEVAADMADYGKGDKAQGKQLQDMMLNYLKMERDMENFMQAADHIIAQGAEVGDQPGSLVKHLEKEVKDRGRNQNTEALKDHEKYQELQQKINDSQHTVPRPSSLAAAALPGGSERTGEDDEEVEMTQEQINTRCPYTGKEMVDPVRNIICKHAYDRAGIQQHMKQRGKRAMCPVSGCTNNKPITSRDLEEHKEMKRYIQNKNKRPQPSTSPSDPTLISDDPSKSSSGSWALVVQE